MPSIFPTGRAFRLGFLDCSAFGAVGIGCRLIRSSSICSCGCGARTAIDAAVFASPSSTPARAAIIGSRGWSGWLWRGSERGLRMRLPPRRQVLEAHDTHPEASLRRRQDELYEGERFVREGDHHGVCPSP